MYNPEKLATLHTRDKQTNTQQENCKIFSIPVWLRCAQIFMCWKIYAEMVELRWLEIPMVKCTYWNGPLNLCYQNLTVCINMTWCMYLNPSKNSFLFAIWYVQTNKIPSVNYFFFLILRCFFPKSCVAI